MMERRQFLKLGGFVTVSVASAGLVGCGGSDLPAAQQGVPPPATGAGWKFPQSIASGDPRPDSILLWTRVVPNNVDDTATPAGKAEVSVRITVTAADNGAKLGGNTALAGDLVVDALIALDPAFDNTLRHKVTGLQPGQLYYYQFQAGDVRSNVGRFKTAPAATADVSQLQFACLTCQDWSINHWGAMSNIVANEQLDFIVHLGDYIYETVGEAFQVGQVESRHGALTLPDGVFKNGTSGAKYANSVNDYRYLYKKYRSDTRLQAVHERFAFIAIWDDHEFSDDAWQDAETYDAADGSNLHQPQRRRNANQAWFEYMPADVSFDSSATGFQNIKIYRDFQFGKLAQLVMTDERLFRSDHVIPESTPNPATGAALGSIGARYFVAQDLYNGVEAQKIAAGGADAVSMLGGTQRDWWKDKMKSATPTWKLWGNEVSLLRMGLNGTDAIATLLSLQIIPTLATAIGTTAAAAGGNVPLAAAIVGASNAGASAALAQAAAGAIAASAAAGGDTAARIQAAAAAGLNATQATVAVLAFGQAQGAAPGGATAQAAAAAQAIAVGYVKPDVQANKANSPFVVASGKQAALAPYFRRFLINCDQWDGYNAERKALMSHLKSNNIGNVVALTGDIHSFFAGTVNDDFDATGGGTPVMVDLVTAGVSSDSFFTYLRQAAAALGDLGALVSYALSVPVPGVGTLALNFNLLDYTMGKAAPTIDSLAAQVSVQLRGALAGKGVPEAALDATVAQVLAGLKANADFNTTLLGVAQQLSGLASNPWLKHLNTDAQGYTVVTVTPGSVTARFRQVNKLVGANAPSTVVAGTTTATVLAGSANVTIS
jgi:alkaline phosphatase D